MLTAISYIRPTRHCLHYSVCLLPVCVAVCSCATHVTSLLNRTIIRDSHTHENRFPVYRAASAMHFAWSATRGISTYACSHCGRCKDNAGSVQIKAKLGPITESQNWLKKAIYCLTRRNMLFQATGQRDPAFWANVLGQLQIHPHTILFLADDSSTACFNLSLPAGKGRERST